MDAPRSQLSHVVRSNAVIPAANHFVQQAKLLRVALSIDVVFAICVHQPVVSKTVHAQQNTRKEHTNDEGTGKSIKVVQHRYDVAVGDLVQAAAKKYIKGYNGNAFAWRPMALC